MRGGIAVAGRAGSGKSTLSRYLVAELGRREREAEVISFASELKREVWELYGLKKGDVGSREALIEHGERRRAVDPCYWVKRAFPRFAHAWSQGVVPVCDDLRRRPEYDWLAFHGFYKVRVTAPDAMRRERLAQQGLDPEFAISSDPTEADHEGWLFDARWHISMERHHVQAARAIVERCEQRGLF